MDSFMLTKALNHHGQELLRAIEENQGKEALQGFDLRPVDYHEYHKRAKEFRFKERQKRQKLIRFIGKKAHLLYAPQDPSQAAPVTKDADNEGLCAVMPPLETFMAVPKGERRRHLMEFLKIQDLIIGQIFKVETTGVFIHVLCLDGGKRREISDLKIQIGCHSYYSEDKDSAMLGLLANYKRGNFVRAKIARVVPKLDKIQIFMRTDFKDMQMVVVNQEEIPAHYKNYMKHQGKTYEQVLDLIPGFYNPATVTHMCKILGLPSNSLMSLMHSATYPRNEYAVELQKVQSVMWAITSTQDGAAHFRAGNQVEALQCLNNALEFHPLNVEALVTRGEVFVNEGNFVQAVQDFERALEIYPSHVNGLKNVYETLVSLGRYFEDRGEIVEAGNAYRRAMDRNSDNTIARDALTRLEAKEQSRIMMEAATKQSAPPAPIAQEPSASHFWEMMSRLQDENRVPDYGRAPKRACNSDEEESQFAGKRHQHEQSQFLRGYTTPHQQYEQTEPLQVYSMPHPQLMYGQNQPVQVYNTPHQQFMHEQSIPLQVFSTPDQQFIYGQNQPLQVYSTPDQQFMYEQSEPRQSYSKSRQQHEPRQGSSRSQHQYEQSGYSRSREQHGRKRYSSSSSSYSSEGPLSPSPSQERVPSPRVVFVMHKDEDVHYSKMYTHAAFREDEDQDQPTSVIESSEGCFRSKDSSRNKVPLSFDEEEERVVPKKSRSHYRSRHSSLEIEPKDRNEDRRRQQRRRHRSRDDRHKSPPHKGRHRDRKTYDTYRYQRRRTDIPRSRKEALISRAPDIVSLKALQEQNTSRREQSREERKLWEASRKPLETAQKPLATVQKPLATVQKPLATVQKPLATVQKPFVTVQNPLETVQKPLSQPQDDDSFSKAKAIAARINEAFRNDPGLMIPKVIDPIPITKIVIPAPVKKTNTKEDKSVAALEAYLANLKAQKKNDLLNDNKNVLNKP